MTKAELEAQRAETQRTIDWVRELAERGEAELPPETRRPPGMSNSQWLHELAERGKAELDQRKEAEG